MSPIESLWAIVRNKIDKMELRCKKPALIVNSRSSWCCFSAEMPDDVMCGMPERLRACLEKCGEFINNETMNQLLFIFLLLYVRD